MDDIVRQAIAKWPNVPDCYGWLGLDARGNWYMRDDRTQAAGPFSSADGGTLASRGSLLRHEKLVDFIQRNYESDAQGQWFFQNGPQRVYVELEATPWIWRVQPDLTLLSHTGQAAEGGDALVDAQGRLYLVTALGVGLVHSMDVALAAEAVESGRWPLQEVQASDLPARYRYVPSPQAWRAGRLEVGESR